MKITIPVQVLADQITSEGKPWHTLLPMTLMLDGTVLTVGTLDGPDMWRGALNKLGSELITEEHSEWLADKIAKATHTLRTLEDWFDPDEEVLVRMSPDERADHCRQAKLISDTIHELSKG